MRFSLFLALLLAVNTEVGDGKLVVEGSPMLPIVSTPRTSGGIYGVSAQPSRVQYLLALTNQEADVQTTEAQVRLAIQRWFDPSDWAVAECVVEKESGFDPFARGRLGEVGLAQTHPIHAWAYPDAWPLAVAGDIEAQVAIMHNQWEGSRWWPWLAQKGRCW